MNRSKEIHRIPLQTAFAYRINEVRLMGGPGRTKTYALIKKGTLQRIRIDGRTLIEGDSLRNLPKYGN